MKKVNWADQLLNFVGIILGVSLAFLINNAAENAQDRAEYKQIVNSFISEILSLRTISD